MEQDRDQRPPCETESGLRFKSEFKMVKFRNREVDSTWGRRQRSFTNNWDDAILGEIELGSIDAYMGMACEGYDPGVSQMHITYIFACDDAAADGGEYTDPNSPWGPWGEMY